MNPSALQAAVYSKLVNDATLIASLSTAWGVDAVFSDVPQENADDTAYYPFVSFGPDSVTPFDDKDTDGGADQIQINVWSRSGDYIEAKQIAARIHTLLHRQSLTITGASHVLTQFQSADFTIDPDGETRRGLLLFIIKYEND